MIRKKSLYRRLILEKTHKTGPDHYARTPVLIQKGMAVLGRHRLKSALALGAVIFALTIPTQASFFFTDAAAKSLVTTHNSQTLPLLQASSNPDPYVALGGGDITIVGGDALLPDSGPIGTMVDVAGEAGSSDQISVYTVHKGDKITDIAKTFDVSVNTILWANNLSRNTALQEGQILVVLPISGVKHTVKAGDSLKSIAAKYKADADEIAAYNASELADGLTVGLEIIIPDGEIATPVAKTKVVRKSGALKDNPAHNYNGPSFPGYYANPLAGGHKTQGLHGYNGVDLAMDCHCTGASVRAAAGGVVIISREGGWGGGYGNYVVISHDNGTQTLYGHLLKNLVHEGATVAQGQTIGLLGSTGRSTGPHLHFEVRGARNPF